MGVVVVVVVVVVSDRGGVWQGKTPDAGQVVHLCQNSP